EAIIGTNPSKFSSAGDGVSDGIKIAQCMSPFSEVPLSTGRIATLDLQGQAKFIDVADSVGGLPGQTAYVATGNYGLAIVNASSAGMPKILAQLPLAGGDATDVAVDPGLGVAAVADNSGGLVLVDVQTPTRPKVIKTISGSSFNHVHII